MYVSLPEVIRGRWLILLILLSINIESFDYLSVCLYVCKSVRLLVCNLHVWMSEILLTQDTHLILRIQFNGLKLLNFFYFTILACMYGLRGSQTDCKNSQKTPNIWAQRTFDICHIYVKTVNRSSSSWDLVCSCIP